MIISFVLYNNAAIVPHKTPYMPNFITHISDTAILIADSSIERFCVSLKCPAYSITLCAAERPLEIAYVAINKYGNIGSI